MPRREGSPISLRLSSLRPLLFGALLLGLAACGEPDARLPSIPADSIGGLKAGSAEALAVADLADDALAPGEITSILEDAGYASGAERTFSGGLEIRSVTVRLLRFGSASGAERYLAWLDGHAEEILGPIDRSSTIGLGGSQVPVYGHLPGGCCPKEVPVYLTAWSGGTNVVTVLVLGPGADEGAVADLAAEIHRAVGGADDDA